MIETRFTPCGVRLRRRSGRDGGLNWLLLPGGPGIGSESLEDLAAALSVPGSIWLVDLPGDGSNREAPGALADPFQVWPDAVVEAAQAVAEPVFAGHSTGGMYLLATAALAGRLRGLALLDTAPDAGWHSRFVAMAAANPLPAVEAATKVYEAAEGVTARNAALAEVAVASAAWNFTPAGLDAGRALLARAPYNAAAVDWSDAHFDHVYRAAWRPTDIPVLRLAGAEDRIVWQGGWAEPCWRTPNVIERAIPGAGHFPWIENPAAVAAAFDELAARILGGGGA